MQLLKSLINLNLNIIGCLSSSLHLSVELRRLLNGNYALTKEERACKKKTSDCKPALSGYSMTIYLLFSH
jgi:hypothetical protein